jgi:peptidoglycan hydrolase-like protein with peptidoglycan-binding domain
MGNRSLKVGMTGPDVKAVQGALNVWGANLGNPDGVFGPHTDTAVRNFQTTKGLDVDGVVGKDTRRELFPIGVATVTLYGMRLKLPEFQPFRKPKHQFHLVPRLTLGPPPPQVIVGSFTRPLYEPTYFPGLFTQVPAPRIPDWNFMVPPAPDDDSSFQPLGFVYDHVELQPGGQTTFPFGGARQDVFVLTMQNVYRRGPDDGAHLEADLGVQIGAPVSNPNGPWTVNPFVQLTDVDRFGTLGAFHYWQPYAQAGFQFMGLGNPRPSLTANIFPINLGLDIGDLLTVNMAGGLALTMDLGTGQVQAGWQFTTGLTLKFGKVK